MQLSPCHPLGPSPSHTRTERENGKRGSSDFFFWSSHPPLFPARPPVPATGTPRLPCVSSLRHCREQRRPKPVFVLGPNRSMPSADPGRRNTTGTLPSVLSRPGCWRRSIAPTGPDLGGAGPKKPSTRGSAGRCLPRQSIQPAEHHPRSGLPLWIEDGCMPVT